MNEQLTTVWARYFSGAAEPFTAIIGVYLNGVAN